MASTVYQKACLETGTFKLPQGAKLPAIDVPLLYVFLADDVYSLKS